VLPCDVRGTLPDSFHVNMKQALRSHGFPRSRTVGYFFALSSNSLFYIYIFFY